MVSSVFSLYHYCIPYYKASCSFIRCHCDCQKGPQLQNTIHIARSSCLNNTFAVRNRTHWYGYEACGLIYNRACRSMTKQRYDISNDKAAVAKQRLCKHVSTTAVVLKQKNGVFSPVCTTII
jgi:hypothetical protein